MVLADLVAHRFCAGQLHHRLKAVLVGADEALVQGVEPPQLLLGAQAPMVDGSAHQGPVALLDVALTYWRLGREQKSRALAWRHDVAGAS